VGIGTTSPSTKLHVVGAGTISGATSLGDILGVTGATTLSSTLGVTGISTFSNNVGIGSATPGYTLDLVGEFNITDAIRVAGDAGTSGYFLTSSAGGAMTWTDPASLSGGTPVWAALKNKETSPFSRAR